MIRDTANVPYLLITLPSAPETPERRVFLTETITLLGRGDPSQNIAHAVGLHLPSVSRDHARIVRRGDQYVLENTNGKFGVGVYEDTLLPGQEHILRHCDDFRIPDRASHFKLRFLANSQETAVEPFWIEQATGQVFVFGTALKLTPQEYKLIAYLHEYRETLCDDKQLIMHLWSPQERIGDRKAHLDVLISNVRKKISAVSGGFSFIDRRPGQGIRFIV